MSKNRDSVVTHNRCPKFVAKHTNVKGEPPSCQNCGRTEKSH